MQLAIVDTANRPTVGNSRSTHFRLYTYNVWKLQAELMETKLRERLDRDALKRIAAVHNVRRIDDSWDDKFMQKW